jgi:predicted nucleotidyltransferase
MQNKYTLDYIKNNNLIVLEAISGSHAYGLNIETSDIDKRGVFICELDDYLCGKYPEQINDENNDITFYELGRFLSLVGTNNPNILELLNIPDDCIIYKHPLFDLITERKNEFITKICRNSFGKYASSQISKAKGLNKKQNWEQDKVTRKDILDFVYVIENGQTIQWKSWNTRYNEKFCGVVNVSNARDLYAVYFDVDANNCFNEKIPEHMREAAKAWRKEEGESMGFGYKGIVKTGEGANVAESNQLRLSSIPKGQTPICLITYNKDAYTQHCKDYLSYQEWLNNRNEARYVETVKHGQSLDGKNIMHCIRLINMAKEIGIGDGIQVRRSDREYLLSIRKGEFDLESLINEAEESIKEMDSIFDNSDLPNKVNMDLINELLIKIRKEYYGIS